MPSEIKRVRDADPVEAPAGVVPDAPGFLLAPIPPALDGNLPLDLDALATLALQRAESGAAWLTRVVQSNGAFAYHYSPPEDRYDINNYNEVRHAGTTYALFQATGFFDDKVMKESAEAAASYLFNSTVSVPGLGAVFLYKGVAKLGGQALALVALLERRRATANYNDDDLVAAMADFMLAMELPAQPGRYYQSYNAPGAELLLTPDSDYYPGEALLALTRLARQFPTGPWLDAARRAATYLLTVRDGDIVAAGQIPRQDHWLAIALSDLYRLHPDPGYATVAFLQAESMIASQHQPGDAEPWRIGASYRAPTVNFTSTATKAEALLAAWELALIAGDNDAATRFANAALRTVQFLMRVQYTTENSGHFPRPDHTIGAWAQDINNPRIRLDFVQHNISALMHAHHLLTPPGAAEQARDMASPATRAEPVRLTGQADPTVDAHELNRANQAVADAARRRSIPVRQSDLFPTLLELGDGAYRQRYESFTSSRTSRIGVRIAGNKFQTNHVLRQAGLPVPAGQLAASIDEAITIAEQIGYPVTLKPISRNKAHGVIVNIGSAEEIRNMFPHAAAESRGQPLLVEQYITGRDYRVLIIDDKHAASLEKAPAFVTGDGKHSVQELVDLENSSPLRSTTRETPHRLILINPPAIHFLSRQGLTLDDIPPAGMRVQVRPTGLSGGGLKIDCTEEIHPDNLAIALQAARIIGLDIAGIDIITPNIAESMWSTGGAIVEVNSGPGFNMHLTPVSGEPRDPGAAVVDMLYPPGQPVRAPVIAVGGTDAARISTQIACMLTSAKSHVGLAAAGRLQIDGMEMGRVASTSYHGIRALLDNAAVEIAVVEIDQEQMTTTGPGFDRCDIAVFSSLSSIEKPSGVYVESLIIASLARGGVLILNADSPGVAALAALSGNAVILISRDAANPAVLAHLRGGGQVVVVQESEPGKVIVMLANSGVIHQLPLAASARQTGSADPERLTMLLAAATAALVQGVAIGLIEAWLQSGEGRSSARPPSRKRHG